MSQRKTNEKPEVYAIHQDGGSWQISRRDFLKAASIGAAVMGTGLHTRFVRPAHGESDLEKLCKTTPSHQNDITDLKLSCDGKYLLSVDEKKKIKCWDFAGHTLMESADAIDDELDFTAFIQGKSAAVRHDADSVRMISVPELKSFGSSVSVKIDNKTITIQALDADGDGNIYGISSDAIFMLKNVDGKFNDQTVLKKASESDGKFTDISVLSSGNFLFILKNSGYGLFDVRSGEITNYDNSTAYAAYAIMPGGAQALLCQKSNNAYRLVSLADGSVIWEKEANENIIGAAVTPDGSYGVLAGAKNGIFLISMADGSEIHRLTTGNTSQSKIVISKDGTQCAVSIGKSILFVSLPDFKLMGCPVDLSEMKDDTKGIQVQKVDKTTGKTITYTLPCGAPIPDGAVCICNCVAGEVCSCDTYTYCSCDTVCSCVGYTYCSCDTVCTCDAEAGHYWYPD